MPSPTEHSVVEEIHILKKLELDLCNIRGRIHYLEKKSVLTSLETTELKNLVRAEQQLMIRRNRLMK